MNRTPSAWFAAYQQREALWVHDENPKRPHALLSSGRHSSGFFNSELVMEDAMLLHEAAADLTNILGKKIALSSVNRVVGPAMGAITLANDLARNIQRLRLIAETAEHGACLRAYTEKDDSDGAKRMVFKRTAIKPGEHILPCEDVLTTGGSVALAIKAIRDAGGVVTPFIACLVNRSGLIAVEGLTIVALIDRPMPTWDPANETCPLCAQGSEAIKPKEASNWKRLTGVYPTE